MVLCFPLAIGCWRAFRRELPCVLLPGGDADGGQCETTRSETVSSVDSMNGLYFKFRRRLRHKAISPRTPLHRPAVHNERHYFPALLFFTSCCYPLESGHRFEGRHPGYTGQKSPGNAEPHRPSRIGPLSRSFVGFFSFSGGDSLAAPCSPLAPAGYTHGTSKPSSFRTSR